MTEQSQQSSTLSQKAGKDCESQIPTRNLSRAVEAKRNWRKTNEEPANTLKTSLRSLSPPSDEADARYQARAEERVRAERDLRSSLLWSHSNVPQRHRRPFKADPQSQWSDTLRRLRERADLETVLMCGKRGTGKTQLAVQIIADYCRDCRPAVYTTAIEFFLELRDAMREGCTGEASVLRRMVTPELLVIDDIHERGESDWENRMLFHLLDRRYRELRDTILITNLLKAEALTSLGPSVVDRIREGGGIIEFLGPSFRKPH